MCCWLWTSAAAQRLPAVVGLAREAGAGCILLTDTPVSTLAAEADAVLGCAHQANRSSIPTWPR